MKKKKIISVIIVLIIVIAAGVWYFNRPLRQNGDIILHGNVDIRQVSLAFSGSERIVEMLADEGDAVANGQVLARLDTQILLLEIEQTKARIAAQEQVVLRLTNGSRPEEIDQAKAKVASAQAEVDLAELQAKRMEEAFKGSAGQAVSAQERDNARASLKVANANLVNAQKVLALAEIGPRAEDIDEARAELEAMRAGLALQEHNLALAELKAPLDAVVRSRLLEPGDMASPQRPVYLLAVNNPKWVRAYVSEVDLGFVKPGQNVEVYIDSQPHKPIMGQVGYISDVAEFTPKTVQTEELRTSLLYEIRVYVQDPDNMLRMGMPATVKIKRGNNGE